MIKYKKVLSRLIIPNATAAAAVILFLLLQYRDLTLDRVLIILVLFILTFSILTIVEYLIISKQVEKGKKKESDFYFWWERKKQKTELPQEKDSEDSDTPES